MFQILVISYFNQSNDTRLCSVCCEGEGEGEGEGDVSFFLVPSAGIAEREQT